MFVASSGLYFFNTSPVNVREPMPCPAIVFSHEYSQTIWCIFCSLSLAGIQTRIAHSKQPECNEWRSRPLGCDGRISPKILFYIMTVFTIIYFVFLITNFWDQKSVVSCLCTYSIDWTVLCKTLDSVVNVRHNVQTSSVQGYKSPIFVITIPTPNYNNSLNCKYFIKL